MSTPNLTEFDPTVIPFQYQLIQDIRQNFDYSKGVQEILLSGSVGSAKTLTVAHLILTHVLLYPRSRALLARRALIDLKDTLLDKLLAHMEGVLIPGQHYLHNKAINKITFANGSEIICRSWADRNFMKFRSLELSCAAIDELTENNAEEFQAFYPEIFSRCNRLPKVPERFVICATNPGSPAHPAFDHFILSKSKRRHVYYSLTSENPFLHSSYIENLKEMYTEKEAQRMLYGKWIELGSEVIYYAYSSHNLINSFTPKIGHPIYIAFDFNIGVGKPMSACCFQHIDSVFYFFNEVVIHGGRTLDVVEELVSRKIVNKNFHYVVTGDSAGRARTTNFNRSDYEVVMEALKSSYIGYELNIRRTNPAVRTRHIIVNGQLCNAKGRRSIRIVKDKCPMLIKGFRLTALKKGHSYREDDTPEYQHITTAAGYGIMRVIEGNKESLTIRKL